MSATGGKSERVAFVIILITIIIKVREPKNSKKRGLPFLFSSKYANRKSKVKVAKAIPECYNIMEYYAGHETYDA